MIGLYGSLFQGSKPKLPRRTPISPKNYESEPLIVDGVPDFSDILDNVLGAEGDYRSLFSTSPAPSLAEVFTVSEAIAKKREGCSSPVLPVVQEGVDSSSDDSVERVVLSPVPSSSSDPSVEEVAPSLVPSQAIVSFVSTRPVSGSVLPPIVELPEDTVGSDSVGTAGKRSVDDGRDRSGIVVEDVSRIGSASGEPKSVDAMVGDVAGVDATAGGSQLPVAPTEVASSVSGAIEKVVGIRDMMKSSVAELASVESVFPSFVSFLPNVSCDAALAELAAPKESQESVSSKLECSVRKVDSLKHEVKELNHVISELRGEAYYSGRGL